ncbi:MAG: porin family protein [Prevotella sp.]|nr:porin family protein [Prevotella sp.]
MKKIFTAIVFAVALVAATPAHAINWGIKGGYNITNMSFSSDVIKDDNKTGFFIGPTVKFAIPLVGLGFDAAAFYDQRDAEMNDKTISQKSINIPVNLRYNIGLGSIASVYFAAGPQFSFNIGNKNYGLENSNSFKFKDSNLSVNLGAGVSLISHLEIGFCYNIAMGNTGEASWTDAASQLYKKDAKSNAWQVSAAYYF